MVNLELLRTYYHRYSTHFWLDFFKGQKLDEIKKLWFHFSILSWLFEYQGRGFNCSQQACLFWNIIWVKLSL